MSPSDVLTYYKSMYNFCKKTGMNINSIRYWIRKGYIPLATQYKLENLTHGELIANIDHDKPSTKNIMDNTIMNIRGYLKLLSCEIQKIETSLPDNFYTNKIAFTFGPAEMPRNEHLYFRDDELKELCRNLEMIASAITEFLDR